jgi:hypothetical protein
MNDSSMFDIFLKDIGPLAAQDHKIRQKVLMEQAPGFQALSFFRSGEVVATNILAYLLTPSAAHGQQDLFLKTFLSALHINLGHHELHSVIVETNAPCYTLKAGRRDPDELLELSEQDPSLSIGGYGYRMMDILIQLKADDECVIVIESKSHGAGDPKNQINDYLEHICKAYPARRKYLPYMKDGEPPGGESIDLAKWNAIVDGHRICHEVDFRKVMITWLELCQAKCVAPKIGFFLRDFAAFLNLEIPKMIPTDTQIGQRVTQIIDAAAVNADGDNAEFYSLVAIYEMHEEIWKRVVMHCMNRMRDLVALELPDWIVRIEGYTSEASGKCYVETVIHRQNWGKEKPDLWIGLGSEDYNGPTYLDLYIRKSEQLSPMTAQEFDDKHLLRIGPKKSDRTRQIRLAGIRDLRSAEGLRSLLTDQAAMHIATEVVRLAGEYQSALDACFPMV